MARDLEQSSGHAYPVVHTFFAKTERERVERDIDDDFGRKWHCHKPQQKYGFTRKPSHFYHYYNKYPVFGEMYVYLKTQAAKASLMLLLDYVLFCAVTVFDEAYHMLALFIFEFCETVRVLLLYPEI